MPIQPPHSKALRKGRHSEPNARYFITFNTKTPSSSLASATTFAALSSTLEKLEHEKILEPTAYTLMPDHVHLLIRLGSKLDLGKTISRMKFEFRKKSAPAPIHWQSSFHDHKLRTDAELHPILHYIYLNPYRAKLITTDQPYPYTHIAPSHWTWFQPLLKQNCPYPEWLAE